MIKIRTTIKDNVFYFGFFRALSDKLADTLRRSNIGPFSFFIFFLRRRRTR